MNYWKTKNSATTIEAIVENSSDVEPDGYAKYQDLIDALDRSLAVIEFAPDGTILTANANFLAVTGYSLREIQGRHHRIFVEARAAESERYEKFWENLRRGVFQGGEFPRVKRDGSEIWIQATYNPVLDDDGKVVRVVKYASDITRQKKMQSEIQNRTQAVIEFDPDGTIITANSLFLAATGYSLAEIRGQHHRMFMDREEANSADYATFWKRLAAGEFKQGVFRRRTKSGRDLWLQGAYSPVFGHDGVVIRVIKSVNDITKDVEAAQRTEELNGSIARSVREMATAIAEISTRISSTAGLAQQMESSTKNAGVVVSDLQQSSEDIGNIVDIIDDFADQTNLLALNATIEAARAGDAGRGFAVVANEVKGLATQTASATSRIRGEVDAIRKKVSQVVVAIEQVSLIIGQVSLNTTGIAASVEEQSVVMRQLKDAADSLKTSHRAYA